MKKYRFNIIINKNKFFKDAKKCKIIDIESYTCSYIEFIKYFESKISISRHDMIISIHFVYSWMPTIFHFKSNKFTSPLKILNKIKSGLNPSIDDIGILKKLFNNSLVGTSKLLHFISPNNLPIWDSNVYRYLTNMQPYKNRLDDIQSYLTYIEFCKEIISEPTFKYLKSRIEKKLKYKLSSMRVIEIVMYEEGKKLKNARK